MTQSALSDKENRTVIDYARRKFAEERWPMSSALRSLREALERLDPKPKPNALPGPVA